jgi:hypothetical protein
MFHTFHFHGCRKCGYIPGASGVSIPKLTQSQIKDLTSSGYEVVQENDTEICICTTLSWRPKFIALAIFHANFC